MNLIKYLNNSYCIFQAAASVTPDILNKLQDVVGPENISSSHTIREHPQITTPAKPHMGLVRATMGTAGPVRARATPLQPRMGPIRACP